MPILKAFLNFPNEAAIIGRLLAGYSDLEVGMMHASQAIRNDLDTVVKAMFRTRGETRRIDVADAFGRQHYAGLELDAEFALAISATRYCLKIRNQYAHCIWYDDLSENLAFTNLEEISKSNTFIKDLSELEVNHVDVTLLKSQEEYFQYATVLLGWVNFEASVISKKTEVNLLSKPTEPKRPALNLEAI